MPDSLILRLLIYIVIGYVVVVGLLALFQNSMIFIPSSTMIDSPDRLGVEWSDHYIDTGDGEHIHGWMLHNRNAKHTVVFSHGNAGNISGRIDVAKMIFDRGASVFLYDYRGYGKSDGSPSEKKLMNDAVRVVEYLENEQGISPGSMIFYGRSLGGPVAAKKAAEFGGAGLVLDSAFLNAKEVASDVYPFVPRFLVRLDFPADKLIQQLDGTPVLILHSRQDEIINFRHSEKLYELASEPKTFVELQGGHNNHHIVSSDLHRTAWDNFLRSLSDE